MHWVGLVIAVQAAVVLLGIPAFIAWLLPWEIPHWLMIIFWIWCGIVGGIGGAYALFMYSWKDGW